MIEWNKVTWYSKLAAVILFVGVALGAFWFGRWYERVISQKSLVDKSPHLSGIVEDFI